MINVGTGEWQVLEWGPQSSEEEVDGLLEGTTGVVTPGGAINSGGRTAIPAYRLAEGYALGEADDNGSTLQFASDRAYEIQMLVGGWFLALAGGHLEDAKGLQIFIASEVDSLTKFVLAAEGVEVESPVVTQLPVASTDQQAEVAA